MTLTRQFLMSGVVASGLIISGCVSNDPKEGGFIGGVTGWVSGTYDERIGERKDSLGALRDANAELDSDQKTLTQKKESSAEKLKKEQQRLAKLEADTNTLSKKVQALKADDEATSQQVADLKRRLSELNSDIKRADGATGADALEGSGGASGADALEGSGGGMSDDSRRRELEAQRRQLEKEYKLLSEMYLQLGS
jgi:DNA repair exonuclease SbcCD ATPase subunit